MRDLVILLVHVIPIILRLVRPGGAHAVVAESVLAKHQLLILNRSRQNAPNLHALDRLIVESVCFGLSRIGSARGDRVQAIHVVELLSGLGEAKISAHLVVAYIKHRRRHAQIRCDGFSE